MPQQQHHITVTTTDGETVRHTTTDPDVAWQLEQLPFTSENVLSVSVMVTDTE
ncbi:hypothetical protein [Kitasatospora sp. NPDC004272]